MRIVNYLHLILQCSAQYVNIALFQPIYVVHQYDLDEKNLNELTRVVIARKYNQPQVQIRWY